MKRQIISVWESEKPFAREEDRSLREHLMENPSDGVDRFTDVTEPEVHFSRPAAKGPVRPSWSVRAADITIWPGARRDWISPPF